MEGGWNDGCVDNLEVQCRSIDQNVHHYKPDGMWLATIFDRISLLHGRLSNTRALHILLLLCIARMYLVGITGCQHVSWLAFEDTAPLRSCAL